jgi:hypothetical protein
MECSDPHAGKANLALIGESTHENKGAHSGETCIAYCRDVHHQLTGITKKTQTDMKGEGHSVESNKGTHKKKDSFGSSELRGGSGGEIVPVNVLDPLLVPVQDEYHGSTGPGHDAQTQNIKERQ